MKVTCDRCQKEIETKYIDTEKGTAKCTECNYIFNCSSQLKTEIDYRRDTIELPLSIRLTKDKDLLQIVYRWLNAQLFWLIPFCICLDTVFILWYPIGFIKVESLPAQLYMMFHFIMCISLTYYCLARIINKTVITVSKGVFQVIDSPLPFFRNISIPLEDLDQLYSRESIHRGKKLSWSSYEVHAILKSERDMRLVAGLNTAQQALYIEQVVEDYLEIRDRPVNGEIARD